MTALIEEGLRGVMAKKPTNKQRKVRLPVCSVGGGPRPGIDLSNSAAIQEMEDVEYIERLKRLK